jgi:hypothetical protein
MKPSYMMIGLHCVADLATATETARMSAYRIAPRKVLRSIRNHDRRSVRRGERLS